MMMAASYSARVVIFLFWILLLEKCTHGDAVILECPSQIYGKRVRLVCIAESTTGLDFKSPLFERDIDFYGTARVNDTVVENGFISKLIDRNSTHMIASLEFNATYSQNEQKIVCTSFHDSSSDSCVIRFTRPDVMVNLTISQSVDNTSVSVDLAWNCEKGFRDVANIALRSTSFKETIRNCRYSSVLNSSADDGMYNLTVLVTSVIQVSISEVFSIIPPLSITPTITDSTVQFNCTRTDVMVEHCAISLHEETTVDTAWEWFNGNDTMVTLVFRRPKGFCHFIASTAYNSSNFWFVYSVFGSFNASSSTGTNTSSTTAPTAINSNIVPKSEVFTCFIVAVLVTVLISTL